MKLNNLFLCCIFVSVALIVSLIGSTSAATTCFGIDSTTAGVCSNNGFCIANDVCTCFAGHSGSNCELQNIGYSYSSGLNNYGQLGDGFTTWKSSLFRVSSWFGLLRINAVSAGSRYSLALTDSGVVYAWGYNGYGQLGTGDTTTQYLPTQIGGALAGKRIISIAACTYHSVALDSNGTVYTWGTNTQGTLDWGWLGYGVGDKTNSYLPKAVAAGTIPTNAVGVYCGKVHSMALTSNGAVYAWGSNQGGQIGDSTTINRETPRRVTLSIMYTTIVSLACGQLHTVALANDGTVYAWGSSTIGQLGDGNSGVHLVTAPMLVEGLLTGKYAVSIAANNLASYALTIDGLLFSWGSNSNGQLGDGTVAMKSSPVQVIYPAAVKFISTIYAGCTSNSVYMITNTSSVYALGENSYGMFGAGTTVTTNAALVKTSTPFPSSTFTAISAGESHALFMVNGTTCYSVFAEDANVCSAHGACVATDTCVCNPGFSEFDCSIPICYGLNASNPTVCSGNGQCMTNETCICYDGYNGDQCQNSIVGYLHASGDDTYGQLGDLNTGTSLAQYVPILATAFRGVPIARIAAGVSFSLVNLPNGTLYSFGFNSQGNLGDGTRNARSVPYPVLPSNNIVGSCAGYLHSLALDKNGTVYAFGDNTYGQLGQGSASPSFSAVPLMVQGLLANQTVVAVSCGNYHSAALIANGTMFTWGYNAYGQLGDSTTTNKLTPTQVYIAGVLYKKRISVISLGGHHTLALVADGTVYSFGYNGYNQIGDGTATNSLLPYQVTGLLSGKKVVTLSAGQASSYAVTSDGVLYSWGYNGYGQLGDGSVTQRSAPTKVVGLLANEQVVRVSGAMIHPSYVTSHVMVLTANATTFVFGSNSLGQLGDGTIAQTNSPKSYSLYYPNRRAVAVSTGYGHSLILYNITDSCFGIPSDDPSVCSYHGNCTLMDTCSCQDGYFGPDCSTFTCFNISSTSESVCSSRGSCVALDTCICRKGFTGASCELEMFGLAYALGQNNVFQLADDDMVNTVSPVLMTGQLTRRFVSNVQAGGDFSVVLTTDGSVMTNGRNYATTIGDGTTTDRQKPYLVSSLRPPTNNIVDICAGSFHSFAVSDRGVILGWGSSFFGDMSSGCPVGGCNYGNLGPLGGSSSRYSAVPVAVSGIAASQLPINVACGRGHTTVMTANGTVWSFGFNRDGEVGIGSYGTYSYIYNPTQVLGIINGVNIIKISSGNYHTLALGINGEVYAWGINGNGQLGDSTTTDKRTPMLVLGALAGKVVVDIAAGVTSSFAVTSDGLVYSWGLNSNGQLGDGTTTQRIVPTLVKGLLGVQIISVTTSKENAFTLAVSANGTAYGWGVNTYGQLGDGTTTQRTSPVPVVNTYSSRRIIAASGGSTHSMFLYNGTFCYGILSDDPNVCSWHGVCTDTDTCDCQPGYYGDECSINSCFGFNSTDSEVCSSHGTCVALDSCSCSSGYTGPNCEQPIFGLTFTLGDNSYGQLGDDYYDSQRLPVQTAYPLTYMKYTKLISSGVDASFAITTDNELYSWGKNIYGILGDGTTSNQNRPIRILPGTKIVSVCSSTGHTLAADSNGRVWAWGVNTLSYTTVCSYYGYACSETSCSCPSGYYPTRTGQLGLGSSYYFSYTPRLVVGIPADQPVIQVACGSYHSLALTANGTVFSWGYNAQSQLGDGTATSYQYTAVSVGSDSSIGGMLGNVNIVSIAAGDSHSLALGENGEVYSWGYNNVGQLGDATLVNKRNPRRVNGALFGQSVAKIAAGRVSSYAVTTDGRVYAWGDNTKGQLGIGSTAQQRFPVLISTLNNITSVSAGTWSDYVLATSSNGTTFGWGENTNGQIGDNTVVLKNSPTPVIRKFSNRVAVAVSGASTHSVFLYNTTYCSFIPDDDPSVCSFRGDCVGPDICICDSGYTGQNCSIAICFNVTGDDPSVCSGNGRCVYKDNCVCSPGYSGLECESADQRFLFASGDDTYSQLGDGFFSTQNYPRQSSIFSRQLFHFAAAGDGFSFAVNFNDGVFALGYNGQGQLGDGTTVNRYYPAKILADKFISRIVACSTHSLALDTSGAVFSWGMNTYGQLGTGDLVSYYLPTAVKGLVNQTVVSIACGSSHSMALTDEGRVYTWGLNTNGQLGDGTKTGSRNTAYRVQQLLNIKRIIDIAAGSIHSVALAEDGSMFSWGDNSVGQLGDGKILGRVMPYPVLGIVAGQSIRSISSGASTTYAMANDGSIYSWGLNSKGNIGDNTIVNKPLPTLNPIVNMTNLVAGTAGNFAVAFNTNGTAFAWGENAKGQLGDGTFIDPRKTPVAVTNTKPQRYITSVSAGKTHSLYLYAGTACFGILYDDPTVCSWHGNCTATDTCSCQPNYTGPDCSVSICYGMNGTDPNVCSGHGRCISLDTCVCRQGYSGNNCQVSNYGFVFTAGDDSDSQLGSRNIGIQPTVVQARLFMGIPMHLVVGAHKYTLLRSVDGTIYGVGNNQYGQLGDGTNQNRSLPVQIPSLKAQNIVGLCGGFSHAMALDISGNVYSWGDNRYGQLGINSTSSSWTPVQVSALSGHTIVAISCGYYHSLALADTGVIYTWGYNLDGELGDNSQTNRLLPVTVGGLLSDKKIVSISSGAYHSIALGRDGTVYNWGMNNRGQLGDTTTTMKILPVQVAGLLFGRTVKSVAAGMYFSTCLTADGAVFSWGANSNGQLGDGTLVDKLNPVAVLGLPANNRISTLSAGGNFVLALSENTTTYSWGDNYYGELGNGSYNITSVSKPVNVVNPYTLTYAVDVAAGNTFSLFLLNGTTCFGKFVEDPSVCSSKGQCIAQDTCQCFPFYNADDCSSYNCFGRNGTDPLVCSGRGFCIAADACICKPGYRGDQCETVVSGYVYSLGDDSKSQLGDGYTFTQTLPTSVGGLITGKAMSGIASGIDFSIAVSTTGQMYGWGVNDASQLGDNSTIDRSTPVAVVGVQTKIVAVCAGNSHGAAVDEHGQVYAWGSNYYGQVGNGDYSFQNVPLPTRVLGVIANETIINVACGAFHTLALSETGTIYGWGNNVDGQLGDGSNRIQVLPVRVGDGLIDNIPIAFISAGYRHSLAIGPFGVLYAWGSNSYGQLGDGSTFNKYSPTEVSPPAIRGKIAISAVGSSDNTYMVSLDNGVYAWGGAFFGQLGDNSTLVQYKPTPQRVVTNITNPRTVYGGRDSAFVLSREGVAHSWGSNTYGQLGDNSFSQRNSAVKVLNTYRDRFIISIAPGRTHTAFLYNATACFGFLSDDENVCSSRGICIANDVCQCSPSFQYHDCSVVACNGRNSTDPMICSGHGQCLPNNTCVCYPQWRGVDCENQSFGYMYGTGQDQVSQLGDGGIVDSRVLIKGRASTIDRKPMRYLASGLSFSFAISTTNDVYAFGINDQGQLGDGTTNNARIPVLNKVSGNISTITAGYSFAVAIDSNYSTYSWGSNVYGQLGLGNSGGQRTTPTVITGLANLQVIQVSCGLGHCLAVTSSGEIYAWGGNEHAQLGDGTTSTSKSKYRPIRVMSIFSIKKAATSFAGAYHSLALSIDGIVYGWGDNSRGQLGDGTTSSTFSVIPQKVQGLEDQLVVEVSGGEFFSCALTKYGKVFCWGANDVGQLGSGTYIDSPIPKQVVGVVVNHTIVKLTGGSSGFMLALSDDGLLFGWGYNINGQLGVNNTYSHSVPVQVGNYTRRSSQFVTAGRFHSLTLFNGTTCFNVLQDDSDVCSGNGTCVGWDTCVCKNGFSGLNCEFTSCNGVNATDPTVCSGHGECKYLDTCVCTGGQYLGDVCQYDACFGVASVDSKVCSGHGRCVAPGNCTCDPGYVGSNCEHTVCYGRNTSDPLVCSGKGFCFTPDNCLCFNTPQPGYTGGNCSAPVCYSRFVDRVTGIESILQLPQATNNLTVDSSLACSGHGSCTSPNKCSCKTGFTDQYCSTPICFNRTAIDPAVCNYGRNGSCIDYNNCTCMTHFENGECVPLVCFGKNSTTDPPACNADRGRGNCLNVDLCACQKGYGGLECEQNICNGVLEYNLTQICHGRGRCDLPDQCTCSPGYNGTDCEYSNCYGKLDNDPTVCSGHGMCSGPNSCTCDDGYAGAQCQLSICYGKLSNDTTHVCSGHGTCLSPNDCDCKYGYSGLECFYPSCFDVNSTELEVCSGNGDCYEPNKCNCTSKYEGMDCSIPTCFGVRSTKRNVCSGNGFCVLPDTCDCFVGRTGINCEENVCFGLNQTDNDVCNGHGTCYGPNRCNCTEGYSGFDCAVPICYSTEAIYPQVCSNEGTCTAPDVCNCTYGKTGGNCDANVCFGIEETGGACSDHGSCIGPDRCSCLNGYSGDKCQHPTCDGISAVDPTVCSGRGECSEPDSCTGCAPGWTGSNCEIPTCYSIPASNSSSCSGNGTCVQPDTCVCQSGYTGADCEAQDDICAETYIMVSTFDEGGDQIIAIADNSCGKIVSSYVIPTASKVVYNQYSNVFMLFMNGGIYKIEHSGSSIIPQFIQSFEIEVADSTTVFVDSATQITIVSLSVQIKVHILDLLYRNETLHSTGDFSIIPGANDTRYVTRDESNNIYVLATNGEGQTCIVMINLDGIFSSFAVFNQFPLITDLQGLMYANGRLFVNSRSMIYRVRSSGALVSSVEIFGGFFGFSKIESDMFIYLDDPHMQHLMVISRTVEVLAPVYIPYPRDLKGRSITLLGSWTPTIQTVSPSYLSIHKQETTIGLQGQYLMFNGVSTVVLYSKEYDITVEQNLVNCVEMETYGDACFVPLVTLPDNIGFAEFQVKINVAGGPTSTAFGMLAGISVVVYRTEISRIYPTTAYQGDTVKIMAPYYNPTSTIVCVFKQLNETGTQQEIQISSTYIGSNHIDCPMPKFDKIQQDSVVLVSTIVEGEEFTSQQEQAFLYFVDARAQTFYDTFDDSVSDLLSVNRSSFGLPQNIEWVQYDERTGRSLVNLTSVLPNNDLTRSAVMVNNAVLTGKDRQVNVELVVGSGVGNLLEVWMSNFETQAHIFGAITNGMNGKKSLNLVYKLGENQKEMSVQSDCSFETGFAYNMIVKLVRPEMESLNNNDESEAVKPTTDQSIVEFTQPWRIDVQLKSHASVLCHVSFTPDIPVANMSSLMLGSSILLGQSLLDSNPASQQQELLVYVDRVWIGCQYSSCNDTVYIPGDNNNIIRNSISDRYKAAMIGLSASLGTVLLWILLVIIAVLLFLLARMIRKHRQEKKKQTEMKANMKTFFDKVATDVELREQMNI